MSSNVLKWTVWERGNKGYKKQIMADTSRSAAKRFIYRDRFNFDEKKGFNLKTGEEIVVCVSGGESGSTEEFEVSVFFCELYKKQRICALPVLNSTVKP